jgi:hypothetical protein
MILGYAAKQGKVRGMDTENTVPLIPDVQVKHEAVIQPLTAV